MGFGCVMVIYHMASMFCGWRALAFQIASINSKKSNDELQEQVETLATTLKAKTVRYIISLKAKWEAAWTPDERATEEMEDGPIPRTSTEFVAALRRPRRWVCGLTLSAMALVQKATIVVWSYTGEDGLSNLDKGWKRIAILRGGVEDKYPIVPVVTAWGPLLCFDKTC